MKSNQFPTKEKLESLRAQYPKGTRVELVFTSDPYTRLKPGAQGTVNHVDSMGTIHIDWDNGSGLGMVPGEDEVRKL